MPGWTFIIHVFVCYTNNQTVRTECCLADHISAHVVVSAGISRLLDKCLSGIHNANYILKSIMCAVILVRGSQIPAYGIRLRMVQYTYLIWIGLGPSILSVIAKSLAYSGPSYPIHLYRPCPQVVLFEAGPKIFFALTAFFRRYK